MTFLFYFQPFLLDGYFITQNERSIRLLIDGKRVENDYTFVADDEEMKVKISYTFNASALGGKNLVTFEELYDLSNPDEPVKVAEHKDIEDDGQTVLITERIIKIHTTATDKDGNKEIEAGKDVTIIDTVTLEGLEIGTQYKLVGWQMLKEENAELLINGKRVEKLNPQYAGTVKEAGNWKIKGSCLPEDRRTDRSVSIYDWGQSSGLPLFSWL